MLWEIKLLLDDNTRLFAFGVGSSPNRYLLERVACVGRHRAADDDYQALCCRMHDHFELEPVGVCRFPTAPLDVDPLSLGGEIESGFYRVVAPGKPCGARDAAHAQPFAVTTAGAGAIIWLLAA